MICPNCKAETRTGAVFCTQCGTAVNAQPLYGTAQPLPLGFSPKISDPAFARYQKNSSAWSLIFAAILAIAAIIGFPVYGNATGEIDWPNSLFYGMGIGGMFLVIAILQTLLKKADKTWDGVVVDKQTYQKSEYDKDTDTHRRYVLYVLKVQKDGGGIKKHQWRDQPGIYNYYAVGDRVRHHKGFPYYEKYDKSRDGHVLCMACMTFVESGQEVCPRCKCPVLK